MPPPSLNLEYIIYRAYEMLTGAPIVGQGGLHGVALLTLEIIAVLGTALTFVLLTLIVYVRIRLIQVEHYGFHALEEAEALQREGEQTVAKNARWEHVLGLSNSPNESDWRRAIMEADIMLGDVLRDRGYVGETIGDQLKGANPQQFTTINYAWEAHKMRNALAHLGEAFPLTERDARTTIDNYQRVFEEFNYI
jgi:hypothetical protein